VKRTVNISTVGSRFGEPPANRMIMDRIKATVAHARGRIAVARMVDALLYNPSEQGAERQQE
jgi:hypothetical protein